MAETIKGMNIKLGLDTTELEANIKSLNFELREQQKDLAAINKNLKYDSGNLDLWKQKQEKLNALLADTKQKLIEQNKQLDQAKKAVAIGAMSEEEFNKFKRSVQYTEAEVANLNGQLETTASKINSLSSIDAAALGKIGSTLTKCITLPAIAAGTALSALAIKTATTVDEMSDTAARLGISVEALQEWEYTAKLLGSSTDAMDSAFVKVNSLLGDIASGNGSKVADSLALIGLTVDDIKGMNAEQAFEVIRNALSQVEDQATRTAVANEFFGEKIGSQLSSVLSASSSEIEKWAEEAKKIGIVSNEDAALASQFTDALDSLKQSAMSLAMSFSSQVLPIFEKLITVLRDKIIPKIKQLIEWWANLSSGVKKFIVIVAGLLVAIGPVLSVVAKVIPMISTLKTAFTAVSGAIQIAGKAIKFSTLGWAALIAIIAIVLLQNEKFRAVLKKVLDVLMMVINKVMDLVARIIESLMPVINALMGLINMLIDAIADFLNDILDVVIMVLNVIIGLIESLIPVLTQITNMLSEILVPIIGIIQAILVPICKIIKAIIGLIVEIIAVIIELIDSVLGVLIEIIQVIVDILGVVIKVIVQILNIIIEILNPVLEIIVALIQPIIEIIGIVIEIIGMLIQLLEPLLNTLLAPITDILGFLFTIIEAIAPILIVIANIIKGVIVPVLKVLFEILKPILDILNAIIAAIRWLFEQAGGFFGWIGSLFGSGSFSDTNAVTNSSTSTSSVDNSSITNNVTINTSGDVDMDSINTALGGAY